MHKFRTNHMVTDNARTSNGRLCLFCPVESLKLPTRWNGHQRTSPDKERIDGIRNGIKQIHKDVNGLKEVLSATHPLAWCDRKYRLVIIIGH